VAIPFAAVSQLSPTQALWRGRIESGLRVVAPLLDLLLAGGNKLSNAFEPVDDTQDIEPGATPGKRPALNDAGR
jgi:hypothetical protein